MSHIAASYHIPSKLRAAFKETTTTVETGECLSSDDAQTLVRALTDRVMAVHRQLCDVTCVKIWLELESGIESRLVEQEHVTGLTLPSLVAAFTCLMCSFVTS